MGFQTARINTQEQNHAVFSGAPRGGLRGLKPPPRRHDLYEGEGGPPPTPLPAPPTLYMLSPPPDNILGAPLAVFNHLNLKNAYATLNSERYPMLDITTNFARNEYIKL